MQDSCSSTPSWKAGLKPASLCRTSPSTLSAVTCGGCAHPSDPAHVLKPGELRRTFEGLEVERDEERESVIRRVRPACPAPCSPVALPSLVDADVLWLSPTVLHVGFCCVWEALLGGAIMYVHKHAHMYTVTVSCSGSGPHGHPKELPGEDGRPMSFFIARKPA